MPAIVSVAKLSKTYASGFQALKNVNLDIQPGEILALLGPNGAGKTTLISIICGIVNASAGSVTVDGHDIVSDYRITRSLIGLVPQELTLGAFDTVWHTLCFSRGLFGKPPNADYLEQALTAKEYMEKGFKHAEDWIDNVSKVLRTDKAKELLADIRKGDSNSWWQGLKKIEDISKDKK